MNNINNIFKLNPVNSSGGVTKIGRPNKVVNTVMAATKKPQNKVKKAVNFSQSITEELNKSYRRG